MRRIIQTSLAVVVLAAWVTACGGGGGTSASATDDNSVHTASNYNRHITTVTHGAGSETPITTLSYASDSSTFSYGSIRTMDSYLLDNGFSSVTVNTAGITSNSPTTLSSNGGNRNIYVGGTTRSYGRFGLMLDKTPNSNGANTEYTMRSMTYVRFFRYKNAVLTNATYNNAASKAVGRVMVTNTEHLTVNCNVSVALGMTGIVQSIDLTLSGCDNGVTTSGYLRFAKNTPDGSLSLAQLGTFAMTVSGNTFTPSFTGGYFGVAGPNGEDIVGEVYVNGSTSVSSVARSTTFTFAFGAFK